MIRVSSSGYSLSFALAAYDRHSDCVHRTYEHEVIDPPLQPPPHLGEINRCRHE